MNSDKKKVAKIFRAMKKQAKSPLHAAKKKEYVEKQAKKMSKKMTWPEREFKKLMKEIGIIIIPQKIVMGKIYDFYEPKSNTLFEVDGNYFHGDRIIYEELSPMQKKNTRNDEYKNTLAIGLGYKLERIWESDLKKNYNGVKIRMKKYFNI